MIDVDAPAPAQTPAPPPVKSRWPQLFFRQLGRRGRAGAADYIYQILIVVIGVYLGITFEAMVSDRDRTRQAQSTLGYLVAEMKRDDADMSRIIAEQQGRERDHDEIAAWLASPNAARSARIDSLLWKLTYSSTVYPRRGVYTSMIAAGHIAQLDRELATTIVNLYENTYTRLAANGEHYDYTLERDYFPAYVRSWDPARRTLITNDPAERIRFRNNVRLMGSWSQYYADLVARSQTELRSVIARIEK